jgi:hypothetical protein
MMCSPVRFRSAPLTHANADDAHPTIRALTLADPVQAHIDAVAVDEQCVILQIKWRDIDSLFGGMVNVATTSSVSEVSADILPRLISFRQCWARITMGFQ